MALADDEFLVPVLIQILNDPEAYKERHHATAALQDIGTPEALDAVVAYYIQRLGSRTAWARLRAARALKDIGTPEALDAVKEFEKRRWWPF